MAAADDKPEKRPRYDLGEANGEFADYLGAMDGASPQVTLRNAFRMYRDWIFAENPGIGRRYQELQRQRKPQG